MVQSFDLPPGEYQRPFSGSDKFRKEGYLRRGDSRICLDPHREISMSKPENVDYVNNHTGWIVLCMAYDDTYIDSSINKVFSSRNYHEMIPDTKFASIDNTSNDIGWIILCDLQDDTYTEFSICKKGSDQDFMKTIPDDIHIRAEYSVKDIGWSILCGLMEEKNNE